MAEHVEKLDYWEANPQRQFEEWLLIMIVDTLAAVRVNQYWQGHVRVDASLHLCQ